MRFAVTLVILAVTCCFLPSVLCAADWPHFYGPASNGFAPDKGINKTWTKNAPRTLWKVPMSDRGYSGPSIALGKVFIIDHQGAQDIVRALDVNNGRQVWEYRYNDAASSNYGFARTTPTVDWSKLYTLSRQGTLNCLDADTGHLLWTKNIIKEFGGKLPTWFLATSPVIDGNKVIVCPGGKDAAVVALDKNNGRLIWKGGGSDTPGYATPVLATINGRYQYVVFTAFSLIGVDANNGKLLWSFPWKTGCDVNAAMPIVIGNSVFITSGYGHGCALIDVAGGAAKVRWQTRDIQSHFNAPILANGYIYGDSDPGNLVCLEAKTGKLCWKQSGFEKGGLIGVDGAILAFSGNTGDLVMVKLSPTRYQELGRFRPLGGQSWSPPVVANGKLFIRNTSTLACLALR